MIARTNPPRAKQPRNLRVYKMNTQPQLRKASQALLMFAMILLTPDMSHASGNQAPSEVPQARGTYRYVYAMFFKLYDLTLYTDAAPQCSPAELLNGQHTVRLEFTYLRTIQKDIILESAEKMLKRNLSASEFASIQERIAQLNAAYTTVRRGDQSVLSYQSGHGTSLEINGHPIMTIPGDDFAPLYFRIWLGDQPICTEMRDQLLGDKGNTPLTNIGA